MSEVRRRRELDTFIRLPIEIYRDDPAWVTPLLMERKETLDPARNPYFRHADAAYWLAWRGGRPVGRISAQIDRLWTARYGPDTGHFGLIEAIDDGEVFRALFDAAADWLAARGARRMLGPFNMSTNEECGLLVSGFEAPPQLLMGHARPYYARRLAEQGLRPVKNLVAFRYMLEDGIPERILRLVSRIDATSNVVIRPFDLRRLASEIEIVVDIFSDAWSENWGMVPMTKEEVAALARGLRPLLSSRLCMIAEMDGEPVAMMLCLPNINEIIGDLGGRLLPFGWAKFLWRLKVRPMRTCRVPLMGVRKALQGTFLGPAIAYALITRIRDNAYEMGFRESELSWILEDNVAMRRMLEAINGQVYKTYRIFERPLGAESSAA